MKLQKYISVLLDSFLMFCLLIFFASAGFQDNLVNGWYQQFLPSGISKPIADIVFLDSLTGFIVTGADTVGNTNYILKTTNGGDNWFINLSALTKFHKIQFINDSTGYAMGALSFYKTTNRGENWNTTGLPGYPVDMYVLNSDTIFMADDQSIVGGLYRTTNGGTSWAKLVNFGSGNPSAVYFFNKDIGFIVRSTDTYKTTDGGYNWSVIPGGAFIQIYFLDSLTGYKTSGDIKKTTDGGMSWVTQQLPTTSGISMNKISVLSKDTIWGVGGDIYNNGYRGITYKTTNGGINWGYQVPLNNNNIGIYELISFSNKINGWAYYIQNTGVHTNTGGSDTTILTVNNNILSQPETFILFQNYPNPFNPVTNIKYEIKIDVKHQTSNIKLIVFDITGRQVNLLVNDEKIPGSYEVIFDGNNLSSGIYFYTLFVNGKVIDTKKMMLIR